MNQHSITQLEETIKRDHNNIAGIVLLQNGEKQYEKYFK